MNWTREEIRNYHQIQANGLSSLYDKEGISKNHPEEREIFLRKYLVIPESVDELLCRFPVKRDNPTMLNILERMAISERGLD